MQKRRNLYKSPKSIQIFIQIADIYTNWQVKKQEVEAEREDRVRLETVSRLCDQPDIRYILSKNYCAKTLKFVQNAVIHVKFAHLFDKFVQSCTKRRNSSQNAAIVLQVKKQEVEAEREDRLRLETVSRLFYLVKLHIRCHVKEIEYTHAKIYTKHRDLYKNDEI